MIQQTVARLRPMAPAKRFWIITNHDLRPRILRQLPKLPKPQVLAEPAGRNTAPAIGLAAFLFASVERGTYETTEGKTKVLVSTKERTKKDTWETIRWLSLGAAVLGLVLVILPGKPE